MMSYDTENSTIAFIIFGAGETWTHPLLHHHFRSRLFLGCARPLLRWTMRMSRWAMKPWRFEDGSQKLAKLDDIVSFLKWRPQTIHFLGGIFRLSMMNHPCWGVPLSRSTQPMAVVGRPFFLDEWWLVKVLNVQTIPYLEYSSFENTGFYCGARYLSLFQILPDYD